MGRPRLIKMELSASPSWFQDTNGCRKSPLNGNENTPFSRCPADETFAWRIVESVAAESHSRASLDFTLPEDL